MTERHTHPGVILAFVTSFTAVAVVLGLFASSVGEAATKASQAAADAKRTALIADAATNPQCDTSSEACRRANAQRQGEGNPVPDIEEVSVIASYCGHIAANDTLAEVRDCVRAEFQRLAGRPLQLTRPPTTTTTRR